MTATPSGHDRAALSRDLADFLIELSIALHKHAMYPEGHPSLAPAAAGVARRATLLLEGRSTLSLGVARQQLVIEGVATDPKHPVLRELAARLHRHHLGAVTFRRGVGAEEVADMLRTVAVEADRSGRPLGLGPPEPLRAWEHVRLHPLTYERLELVEDQPASGTRGDLLWVGLARAALAVEGTDDTPPPTEPAVIAQAIDQRTHTAGEAYDQVIVGYLLQIAEELKAAGSAEAVALRRRTSRLIRTLKPETLRRLVEMGGDAAQRRKFVHDATDGMAVDAVLELLKAAAESSSQTISHSLVRMLTKLAAHAADGTDDVRPQADAALRDQVRRLLEGWRLVDPNPTAYGATLQRLAQARPLFAAPVEATHSPEPDRVVAMALELDLPSPRVLGAVDQLVTEGKLAPMLEVLAAEPPDARAAAAVWEHVATPPVVRQIVARNPIDFAALDHLLPRLLVEGLEPLLDELAASESRTTRRALLDRLARVGPPIAPLVVARVGDERWYVVRNMLVLLDSLPALPEGFSPTAWIAHPDPRVRREAVKLLLKVPAERERAIVAGVKDDDPRIRWLVLAAAQEGCPATALPLVAQLVRDAGAPSDLRVAGIRALAASGTATALAALLELVDGGTTLLGRRRLAPKSLEVVAALVALARGWSREQRAGALLALAAASPDADIRRAADARGNMS